MGVSCELVEDVGETIACRLAHLGDLVVAELEEHGQELVVDCVLAEELCILAQVLSKH